MYFFRQEITFCFFLDRRVTTCDKYLKFSNLRTNSNYNEGTILTQRRKQTSSDLHSKKKLFFSKKVYHRFQTGKFKLLT